MVCSTKLDFTLIAHFHIDYSHHFISSVFTFLPSTVCSAKLEEDKNKLQDPKQTFETFLLRGSLYKNSLSVCCVASQTMCFIYAPRKDICFQVCCRCGWVLLKIRWQYDCSHMDFITSVHTSRAQLSRDPLNTHRDGCRFTQESQMEIEKKNNNLLPGTKF